MVDTLATVLRESPVGDIPGDYQAVAEALIAYAGDPTPAKEKKLALSMCSLMGDEVRDMSFEELLEDYYNHDDGLAEDEGMKATCAALSTQVPFPLSLLSSSPSS